MYALTVLPLRHYIIVNNAYTIISVASLWAAVVVCVHKWNYIVCWTSFGRIPPISSCDYHLSLWYVSKQLWVQTSWGRVEKVCIPSIFQIPILQHFIPVWSSSQKRWGQRSGKLRPLVQCAGVHEGDGRYMLMAVGGQEKAQCIMIHYWI